MDFINVMKEDREIFDLMEEELKRQREGIELIASENFASKAVMEAMGSHLTNKYAEGYPSKRYYGGCEIVDNIEEIARNRAKKLFGAEHANVQPHSGSQANMAVYFTILEPGDTVLGMDLSHGGHLTHGSPVNFSGKLFNFVSYGVDSETEEINYDNVRELALKHKPKLIVAGASAYSRIIDFKKFRDICDEVGAYFMVDMAHIAGLVAAGEHPSPVPYADFVTSTKAVCFKEALEPSFKEYMKNVVLNCKVLGDELVKSGFKLVSNGTDNHLILVDLTNKDITGKEAENILDSIGITVNKNTVPNETRSPFVTSGIRIGTAAVTTRGFDVEDMKEIASIINEAIDNKDSNLEILRDRVKSLCSKYPLYN